MGIPNSSEFYPVEFCWAFGHNIRMFLTRPANLSDVDTLYNFILELAKFEGKDLSSLPVTREKLKTFGFGPKPFFHAEIAEENKQPVGYALYSYGFSGHQGSPFLYIDDLYVTPKFRNQGIGTFLLKKLSQYAEEAGCCRMEWHAFDWNDKAIAFYENLGGKLRKDLILIRLENYDLSN